MAPVEAKLRLGPISPAASAPLYQQIIDAVKREIAAGRVPPGSALPSFRALGESLLVSLITVKRAYEELEREGLVVCHQGLGCFVAEGGADRTRATQRDAARDALRAAVRAGREGQLSDQELHRMLDEALDTEAGGRS